MAPSLSAPVIGTLHQWRDLSPNDRHTVMLLNDRMRQGTSVDQIHEFFRTGRGREFPSWVREDFLNRVGELRDGAPDTLATAKVIRTA